MVTRAEKATFGDFQTPIGLARELVSLLVRTAGPVQAIVEPTCGVGNLLVAASEGFAGSPLLLGMDRNLGYIEQARARLRESGAQRVQCVQSDMFELDWGKCLGELSGELLVLGNPPWVTNSQLGALGSENLPQKRSEGRGQGLEALLGSSNFDVSQWLLEVLLEAMPTGRSTMAMLIKRTVARKLLHRAWTKGLGVGDARIYGLNAQRWFGASVDACLLLLRRVEEGAPFCSLYEDLGTSAPSRRIGHDRGLLIADVDRWREVSHLRAGAAQRQKWRSGLKHDCAKILELRPRESGLYNGLGQSADVEDAHCFPLVKSSDVAHRRGDQGKRVIVTQRKVGADTSGLEQSAPRLWCYLCEHRGYFEQRKSRVYQNKPPFSVFGVGEYSFAPWKIAVSGLHKQMRFVLYGPVDGRPVIFDDAVYFLSFEDKDRAQAMLAWLRSQTARRFFDCLVFRDGKRPVTARLLGQLSLDQGATEGGGREVQGRSDARARALVCRGG